MISTSRGDRLVLQAENGRREWGRYEVDAQTALLIGGTPMVERLLRQAIRGRTAGDTVMERWAVEIEDHVRGMEDCLLILSLTFGPGDRPAR